MSHPHDSSSAHPGKESPQSIAQKLAIALNRPVGWANGLDGTTDQLHELFRAQLICRCSHCGNLVTVNGEKLETFLKVNPEKTPRDGLSTLSFLACQKGGKL